MLNGMGVKDNPVECGTITNDPGMIPMLQTSNTSMSLAS